MLSHTYSETIPAESGLSVSKLLLKYLILEGVDKVFGYPGTALQFVLDELRLSRDIDYVICRQETGAAYMADAYSRISGKLGVVLVTTGPGATNALTGVMNAQSINSSLLVISAEVPQKYWGKSALQAGVDCSLNVTEVYRNACQYSALVTDASNFQELLTQALREALSVPHRATHISLPEQISGQPVGEIRFPSSPSNYRAVPASANGDQVERVLDILTKAELPLIWMGNGCRRVLLPAEGQDQDEAARIDQRRKNFYAFLERFTIPVLTTGDGKGLFPESNPLSLRNYGLGGGPWASGYVNPQCTDPALSAKYDALCVLGSSLSQLGTGSWAEEMIPDGPLIQVDADQRVIGRGFPIEMGVVAELGAFLDWLVEAGHERAPDRTVCDQRRLYLEKVQSIEYPSPNPQAKYLQALGNHLPSDSHVFVDACSADFLSLLYMVVDPPMQMHNSLVQGPIGSAIAGVVGAAFATDRPCVAISGDGGFMMQGSEVNTAAQHGLGCLWVVFENGELGTVVQKMWEDFPGSDEKSWQKLLAIGKADLVKFAEGLGADAVKVTSLEAMGPAVDEALRRGNDQRRPQVIVVPTPVYPIPKIPHPCD